MTTTCAFKIEDPSRGPGRVHFTAPDEGFGLEGTPKPKIQRDPSPPKRKPYMWYAAVLRLHAEHKNIHGNLKSLKVNHGTAQRLDQGLNIDRLDRDRASKSHRRVRNS